MQSQRDFMRRLYLELMGVEELVVQAYANAEARGEVTRKRNEHDISSLDYAQALWRDGMRKGWLLGHIQPEV